MAKCLNVNDPGYQLLKDIYKSEIDTSNIIRNWQKLNNSEAIPTPLQASTYLRNKKTAFNLKTREFGEALLANLRRERIGHSYMGGFVVNNSDPTIEDYNERVYDERVLISNAKRLRRYLDTNNIPQDFVDLVRADKTYQVVLRYDKITSLDMIEKSRSWDTPRSRAVVKHLMRLFPEINVVMKRPGEAEQMYKEIVSWKKSKVPFKDINSFYVDGTAVLIQGRVTDETLIEEMLHPFIEAVRVDNKGLYNSLLAEASKTFPEMVQEIKDAYNQNDRGFNNTDRDIEIVTQGLTRHFKKEYETEPPKSFLDKVKEMLEWFFNVIQDLNKYLTGRPLPVSAINPNATMSDVAKLLNTEGIQFKLDVNTNGRVKYSLSPAKNSQVNAALSIANSLQTEVVNRMFHLARKEDSELSTLAANVNDEAPSSIVSLNDENHEYTNLTTKKIYQSVTNAIKGDLQLDYDATLEIEIGNQVDALLDEVVTSMQSQTSASLEVP